MKMASTTQDELYRALLAVSGQQTPALGDANAMLADVIAQLREVGSSVPTAAPVSNRPTTTTSQDSGSTDRALLAVSGQQTPALGDANALLADVIAQLREVPSSVPTTAPASRTQTTTTSQDNGSTDRALLAVSGQQTPAIGDATAMLADVIAQIGELRSSSPTPLAASKTQTTAQTKSNDSGSTLGSVASTVLTSGFGLAPLISGLVSLFSGGDAAAPPPLVKYALPAAVDFQAAESQGQVTGVDYNQMGMPRSYAPAAASGSANGTANGTGNGAAPQITVNVQAMDARSFMDRSNDIALAVRDAMLNLNAINDVVNEL
jgi:uncharacterized protein YggU (UPF0235/DUF167 family)